MQSNWLGTNGVDKKSTYKNWNRLIRWVLPAKFWCTGIGRHWLLGLIAQKRRMPEIWTLKQSELPCADRTRGWKYSIFILTWYTKTMNINPYLNGTEDRDRGRYPPVVWVMCARIDVCVRVWILVQTDCHSGIVPFAAAISPCAQPHFSDYSGKHSRIF